MTAAAAAVATAMQVSLDTALRVFGQLQDWLAGADGHPVAAPPQVELPQQAHHCASCAAAAAAVAAAAAAAAADAGAAVDSCAGGGGGAAAAAAEECLTMIAAVEAAANSAVWQVGPEGSSCQRQA